MSFRLEPKKEKTTFFHVADQHDVLFQAVLHYGETAQINVAIEELSELIQQLCKVQRGEMDAEHLAEEMADVDIMMEQLLMVFKNADAVQDWEEKKVRRLRGRLGI